MNKKDNDDSIQRLINMVHVIRLLGQENGTTLTEISSKVKISRWTASRIIDRLSLAGLEIQNVKPANKTDKREKYLKVNKDAFWTMTLPSVLFDKEEKELFSLLLGFANDIPVLNRKASSLQDKIKWVDSVPSNKILNVPRPGKSINANTPEVMKVILKAIDEGKWIKMEYYHSRYDENYVITAVPTCLFLYDGSFYLRCIKNGEHKYKTYAIERIIGIPEIVKPQEKIKTVANDMKDLLSDPFGPFGTGEFFTAKIFIEAEQAYYVQQINWPDTCTIEEQEDSSIILTVRTSSALQLEQWIVSQKGQASVIEPQWLKEDVISWLKHALLMAETQQTP